MHTKFVGLICLALILGGCSGMKTPQRPEASSCEEACPQAEEIEKIKDGQRVLFGLQILDVTLGILRTIR